MVKSRSLLLIISGILLVALSALATFFGLASVGIIETGVESLTIELLDNEKEYDGTSITASGYKITEGELASDHSLVVNYKGSQVDVGTSTCSADINVINSKGINVTDEYAITCKDATLQVTPRPIKIVPEDSSKQYDGSVITGEYFDIINGSLVNGDVIEPTYTIVDQSSSVGEYTLEIKCVIYNYAGFDVTKNYDIKYNSTVVQISSMPITVSTKSVEKFYDGKNNDGLFGFEILNGKLAEGHTIEAVYEPITNTNVGNYDIKFDTVRVYDKDHNDVSSNYTIFPQNQGKLTIKGIEATVEALAPISTGHTYNNESYEHDRTGLYRIYSVNNVASSKLIDENDYLYINVKYYDHNHKELTNGKGELITPINAGKYYIQFVGASVYRLNVEDGFTSINLDNPESYTNVSSNYNISLTNIYEYYEYEIAKKDIEFAALDQADKTYNGNELSDNEKYDITKYEIVSGGELLQSDEINTFNVSVEYRLDGQVVENPIDANTYKIHINKVNDPYNVLVQNYNVKFSEEGSNFVISKQKVVLEVANHERPYDGTLEEYGKNYIIKAGDFHNNDEDQFEVKLAYKLNNVDVDAIDADDYSVAIVGTNGLLDKNYEFEYNDTTMATYKITKIDIWVLPTKNIVSEYSSKVFEYDPTRYVVKDANLNDINLDLGKVEFETSYHLQNAETGLFNSVGTEEAIDVAKYMVVFKNITFKDQNSAIARNYNMKFFGYNEFSRYDDFRSVLEITTIKEQLAIETIVPEEKFKVYDGEKFELGIESFRIIDTIYFDRAFLRPNDKLKLEIEYYSNGVKLNANNNEYVLNAGKYEIRVTGAKVYRLLFENGFTEINYDNPQSYKDVTSSYNLVLDYLTNSFEYEIRKAELQFKPIASGISSKEYDAKPLSVNGKYDVSKYEIVKNKDLLEQSQLDDFDIVVKYLDRNNNIVDDPINANTYQVAIDEVTSTNASINKNFVLLGTEDTVKFDINKKDVTVELNVNTQTFQYDGEVKTCTPYINGLISGDEENVIVDVKYYDSNDNEVEEVVNAGKYYVQIDSINQTIENYNIDWSKSNKKEFCEITKKPISFELRDAFKTFDGTDLEYSIDNVIYNNYDLLSGHELDSVKYKDTNSKLVYSVYDAIVVERKNSIDVSFDRIVVKIVDKNGNDVSSNYEQKLSHESNPRATKFNLEFEPFQASFTFGTMEKTYDNESLKFCSDSVALSEDYFVTKNDQECLVYNPYFNVTWVNESTAPKGTIYKIVDCIMESDVEAMEDYEDIYCEPAFFYFIDGKYYEVTDDFVSFDDSNSSMPKYKINRADLIIEISDIQKYYDDEPIDTTDIVCSYIGSSAKHYEYYNSLTFYVIGNGIDIGTYKIDIEGDYDDTNFNISVKYGTLSILPSSITINVFNFRKVYDGEPISESDIEDNFEILGYYSNLYERSNIILTTDFGNENVDVYDITPEFLDESENKNFNINVIYGTAEILPAKVTITPLNTIKTYDGTEFGSVDYVVSGEGKDIFEQTSFVDLWCYGTEAGQHSIDNNSSYDTNNFDVEWNLGNVQITKAKVSVSAKNTTKVYDGTEFGSVDYIVSGEGKDIFEQTSFVDLWCYGTEAGQHSIDNNSSYDTNNFDVEWNLGNVQITKAKVSVSAKNTTKAYDGTEFGSVDYVISGEAKDLFEQSASIDLWCSGIEVGQHSIDNNSSYDTNYFDVEWNLGNVQITKAKVSVSAKNTTKAYDGTEFGSVDYVISGEAKDLFEQSASIDLWCSGTEVGLYSIDNNSSYDTNNFEVEWNLGNVQITKAKVSVSAKNTTKAYDGTEFGSVDYVISGEAKALFTQSASIDLWCSGTEVGQHSIDNNSSYDTNYFEVEWNLGNIQITKAKVSVSAKNTTKAYDGTEFGSVDYVISGEAKALFTQSASIDLWCSGTEVGLYSIDNNSSYDTNNFEVEWNLGNVQITKAKVTVSAKNTTKAYDGTEFGSVDYVISGEAKALFTQSASIDLWCSGTEVGQHSIDNNSSYDTNYFEVEWNLGNIQITKAKVSVSAKNTTKAYDGTEFGSVDYVISGEAKALFTQSASIDLWCSGTEVGSYSIDNNSSYDTNYFEVEWNLGNVQITKAKVSVSAKNTTKVYDGTEFGSVDYVISGEAKDLFEQSAGIDLWCSGTEVGSYSIDNNSSYDTNNFDVEWNLVNVQITKAKVSVSAKNATKVYDGTEFGSIDYIVSGESKTLFTQSASIDLWCSGTEVGLYSIDNNSSYDTNNFEVEWNLGNVQITKAKVSIIPTNYEKYYDGEGYSSTSNYVISGESADLYNGYVVVGCSNVDAQTHTISVIDYEDNSNFEITTKEATLTIKPREVYVVVSNATIIAGNYYTPEYNIINDITGEVIVNAYSDYYDITGTFTLTVDVDYNQNYNVTKIDGTLTVI